jgi:phage tail-like protein
MIVSDFFARADLVGRRIVLSWNIGLKGTGNLAGIPSIQVRRKIRDFEFGPVVPGDTSIVYDSVSGPPPGASVSLLNPWERIENNIRTVTAVETASRNIAGRIAEVYRCTISTCYDQFNRALGRTIEVMDLGDAIGGLQPGTTYYYILIVNWPSGVKTMRSVAAPGEGFGLSRVMYESLPSIFKRHDVVSRQATPGAEGIPEAVARSGQLRRFIDLFGTSLDMMRSGAEGLRGLRSIDSVDYRMLPYLAKWIGWSIPADKSVAVQRNEIINAPELYTLIGTIPGLKLWAERLTGWNCGIKEFIHNVFKTNAPEYIDTWEIYGMEQAGGVWTAPLKQISGETFDCRPAIAFEPGGARRLAWVNNPGSVETIYMLREGIDTAPVRASQGAPDDNPAYQEANPAIAVDGANMILFFDSGREGIGDIYMRTFAGMGPGEAAQRLTEGPFDDRRPAALRDSAGRMHCAWRSDRRGKPEIWWRVRDGGVWSAPVRLSEALDGDDYPALVAAGAGKVRAFWSSNRGDRTNIMTSVYAAGVWSDPEAVTDGRYRDTAPSAVRHGTTTELFWHSNREKGWRVWHMSQTGGVWSAPEALTPWYSSHKEPAAAIDGSGHIRLVWRSQQGAGRFRSRTVDTKDAGMMARMRTINDRSHYLYDAGKKNDDFYSPDTVGIFANTGIADPAVIAANVERARKYMEPFRPLTTRLVWITGEAVVEETIDDPEPIGES